MFTGIIKNLGILINVTPIAKGRSLTIRTDQAVIRALQKGDSIAINGVCTTVIRFSSNEFTVQLLEESLLKTTLGSMKQGAKVHLELAMTPSTRMGGHIVQGHVDEVGTILDIKDSSPFAVITIQFSKQFQAYLVPKGSITIDGISLTVVDITPDTFTCHLIPQTIGETLFKAKQKGDKVNLEYDIIGKYLFRFYSLGQNKESVKQVKDDFSGSEEFRNILEKAGYIYE